MSAFSDSLAQEFTLQGNTSFQRQISQVMSGDTEALSQFGTSLELTPGQHQASRATSTELRRNVQLFQDSGRLAEFEEFVNRDGQNPLGIDTLGDLNARAEKDILPAVFDMLSIGNYTTVGFLDEMVRTGDIWEAFKQAGSLIRSTSSPVERS